MEVVERPAPMDYLKERMGVKLVEKVHYGVGMEWSGADNDVTFRLRPVRRIATALINSIASTRRHHEILLFTKGRPPRNLLSNDSALLTNFLRSIQVNANCSNWWKWAQTNKQKRRRNLIFKNLELPTAHQLKWYEKSIEHRIINRQQIASWREMGLLLWWCCLSFYLFSWCLIVPSPWSKQLQLLQQLWIDP